MEKKWSITASNNTGFKLECERGIISLLDSYGNMICEFMEDDMACVLEYSSENTIRSRIGQCKCGNVVQSYQNFCSECGIRLVWKKVDMLSN